ncbi:helix-turn-helix domain-containing protein [Streptomyces atratus]
MEFEIREDRHRKGRRLTREREAYLQLMQQGRSSTEACRIVGINVRTGKRWRNGWHGSGTRARVTVGSDPTPTASSVKGRPGGRPFCVSARHVRSG